jgi:fido (protein-threonine AMPylation protein)
MVCLPSSDPLLCDTSEKAERETTNTLKQLLYIEELVAMGVQEIRESHVLGFQRIAVDGVFPCAGLYRTLTRTATLEGGGVTHVPPEPAVIVGHVREALDVINGMLAETRKEGTTYTQRAKIALKAAAYALWRINWIHPFAGGNGRTARAVAYLILCIDFGGPLPGKPQMPTLIAGRREAYEAALRIADAGEAQGVARLEPMTALVSETIIQQLRSVVDNVVVASTGTKPQRQSLTQKERHRAKAARKAAHDARRRNRGK